MDITVEIDMKLFRELLREADLINDFSKMEYQIYKFRKVHSCAFEFYRLHSENYRDNYDNSFGTDYGVRLIFENQKDAILFKMRYL